MKIRRFIAVFLSALTLCGLLTVPASALEDPDIRAKAALLVEAETGTILYDKNCHDELSIASTTKIMSALLVFEAIDRGELRLDQSITATASALRGLPEDGSTADIVEGETLTVEQLLYCMLVISANETCNILGEAVAGSVEGFVERMNQRAQELGCQNTHFANTTGLTQSGHYSSAYDLYLITRQAMQYDEFMTMVNTKSYEIPPTNKTEEERVLHSTNALISNWRLAGYLYSGAQGIKTGSTDAAGQCLVSSAVRGSRTLISVVLGAERVEKENGSGYIVESFTETARLFDWGFDNFSAQQVLDKNELVQEVQVSLSKEVGSVAVHPAEDASAMLPKDIDISALTRTITLDNDPALAPIAAGDRLGEITVSYNGTDYVTVPLLAVADVSASRFLLAGHTISEFFSQRSARIAVIALLVLVVALVLWFRIYGRNRRYGKGGNTQYRHRTYRGRRH
jgi:D-alanyl-D-alanine carboxypeptidase (penicillin-binding protein 5/6)